MTDSWAIMDDSGVLYTGNEAGMRGLFKSDHIYQQNEIKGDLRLIEIHEVRK